MLDRNNKLQAENKLLLEELDKEKASYNKEFSDYYKLEKEVQDLKTRCASIKSQFLTEETAYKEELQLKYDKMRRLSDEYDYIDRKSTMPLNIEHSKMYDAVKRGARYV